MQNLNLHNNNFMKKIILGALISLSGYVSIAQPVKGLMFTGGGLSVLSNTSSQPVSLFTSTESNSQSKGFKVSPIFGYFISNHLAIGAQFNTGYSLEKQTQNDFRNGSVNKITTSSIDLGGSLFVRYYMPITDKLFFTLNGSVNYIKTDSKIKTESNYTFGAFTQTSVYKTDGMTTNYGLGISPGLDYFFNKHWGLRTTFGMFGYNYSELKNISYINNTIAKGFGLNLNTSTFTLAVNYYFGGKKETEVKPQ